MRRLRNVKIVATLGPASNDYDTIRALYEAGADVFRLNMSHGDHSEIAARHAIIRRVEADLGRPIAILADLQGPKLRVGTFAGGEVELVKVGQAFRLRSRRHGRRRAAVCACPIPKSSRRWNRASHAAGQRRQDPSVKVEDCGADFAECTVLRGRHDIQPQRRERARRGAAGGGAI